MSQVFETNEIVYRGLILYEAVRKTPLEDAYTNIKEVKPNLEYADFEYWYHRFSNRQHDLKHDKSSDPKPLGFSDMPILVVDNIVGYLGLVEKLSARKVCRHVRAVVDGQTSEFGEAKLLITKNSCQIEYEGLTIEYSAQENGTYRLKTPRKTISLEGDHFRAALREFASVITNPKWSFQNVAFENSWHPDTDLRTILFFNFLLPIHKIDVKCLTIEARTFESLGMLLPSFKTECLHFRLFDPLDAFEYLLSAIVRKDQWKNLTEIHIGSVPDGFPIEALFRARKVNVYGLKLTEDHLVKIREILFKTPTFESFEIFDRKSDRREKLSVLTDRVMSAHSAYNPDTKVYHIENSKDYIQISIKGVDNVRLSIQRVRS